MTYTPLPILQVARELAREIRDICPPKVWELPVRASRVARYLGYSLELREDLRGRAELEFGNRIVIKKGVATDVARFALAHEIGHAFLLERRSELVSQWTVPQQERFANAFAAEILLPEGTRATLRRSLLGAETPADILRVAATAGVTASCLLTFGSSHENWFANSLLLVLRVRHAPNVRTGRDARPRIVAAHCDRGRYYIPSNQSLNTFLGDDTWVRQLTPGRMTSSDTCRLMLSVRTSLVRPRWSKQRVEAQASAMRLRSSAHDASAYFIVVARVHDGTAAG